MCEQQFLSMPRKGSFLLTRKAGRLQGRPPWASIINEFCHYRSTLIECLQHCVRIFSRRGELG